MVNRPKDQGTAWESELVSRAHNAGIMGARLAEGGTRDLGDVWLVNPPNETGGWNTIVGVAWKRLTNQGGSRRQPDGERDLVAVTVDDFLTLVELASIEAYEIGFILEAKARQTLNITRTLHKARLKARGLTND